MEVLIMTYQKNTGRSYTQSCFPKGFTLIELLVVVLIIGILAAVAVPQYQKAVEKSKAVQALALLKTTYQAAKAYELANGSWPTSFDQLDVDIPWTEKIPVTIAYYHHTLSNQDWSLVLSHSDSTPAIWLIRHSGPYAYAGFIMQQNTSADNSVPAGKLLCVEGTTSGGFVHSFFAKHQKGDYCKKIMKGTEILNTEANRSFIL